MWFPLVKLEGEKSPFLEEGGRSQERNCYVESGDEAHGFQFQDLNTTGLLSESESKTFIDPRGNRLTRPGQGLTVNFNYLH